MYLCHAHTTNQMGRAEIILDETPPEYLQVEETGTPGRTSAADGWLVGWLVVTLDSATSICNGKIAPTATVIMIYGRKVTKTRSNQLLKPEVRVSETRQSVVSQTMSLLRGRFHSSICITKISC